MLPCLEGGGAKSFGPAIPPPPLPIINDQSLIGLDLLAYSKTKLCPCRLKNETLVYLSEIFQRKQ